MKLLINLCAHDGIVSHYTGVGTMVKRYINTFLRLLNQEDITFHLNLFTPTYDRNSHNFSPITYQLHRSVNNVTIYEVSNGTNDNYGTPPSWHVLAQNTAQIINGIDTTAYDKILTLIVDEPFIPTLELINQEAKHKIVWIPHSTVKIHLLDNRLLNSQHYNDIQLLEQQAISYINSYENAYLGCVGQFIKDFFIKEYQVKESKILDIINGEILDISNDVVYCPESIELYETIKDYEALVLTFGRLEDYKNLTGTMFLGEALGLPTVVISQTYQNYKNLLEDTQNIAQKTNTKIFTNPPFDFARYILNNYDKKIILVIPSKEEIMGLIINEVRKLNKDNILIVANDVNGLREQITDMQDGLLVDIDDIANSAPKILNYFNDSDMALLNSNAQKRLQEDYDFVKNCLAFLNQIL